MPTLLANPTRRARLAGPISVRPAPRIDPPFDDELTPVPWLGRQTQTRPGHGRHDVALQLSLDFSDGKTRRTGPPVVSPPAAADQPGPATEARIAARRFLATCLEVLDGYRPAAHLRQLTSPPEFARVSEEIARAGRRVGRPERATPKTRVRLREWRVCEPRGGVVEVAAVLSSGAGNGAGGGATVWAMAIRLERRQAHWLCTVAQVI